VEFQSCPIYGINVRAFIVWYAFSMPPAVMPFQFGLGAETAFAQKTRVDSDYWPKIHSLAGVRILIGLHRFIHHVNYSM
jgi:hypothetical protein